MINKLKQLNVDRMLDLDEAVELFSAAASMEQGYRALGLSVPEWLQRAITNLREEIERRVRANDLALMQSLETQLEGMKTVSERKQDVQRQLAELQKRLGMKAAPAKARG